jgi:N-acetylglucosamine-6-phosphate deacetylase
VIISAPHALFPGGLAADVLAAGMPAGISDLGDEPVIVREGEPPMRADGTLAGATLRLDDAVARAVAIGFRARATWVGGELVHDELGVAA